MHPTPLPPESGGSRQVHVEGNREAVLHPRLQIQLCANRRWVGLIWIFALSMLVVAGGARASFHEMQIEQVIGGVGGDSTAQAIQLRMRTPGQNFVSGAKLMAFDAAGNNPVLLIQFPSNVPTGAVGSRILVTSASFLTHTNSALTGDFTFTNLIPAGYLAAGRIAYTNSSGGILWSLSFGGSNYTGANTGLTTNDANGNFGPPCSGPLPSSTDQALLFQGAADAFSTNNAADYALTGGAATFTNNAGNSATVILGGTALPKIARGAVRVGLQCIATGLGAPIDLVPPNDGSGRLFVVDQTGQVRIIKNGKLLAIPLMDVASRLVGINPSSDERGLLGLALHPDFNNAGSAGHRKLYTYTSEPVTGAADFTVPMTGTPNHQSVVAEWQVSAGNPDAVDLATRREVLRIDEPQSNHNGGKLAFRPSDGCLYISLGDGGAANDVGDGHGASGNGQNTGNVLGKILRIDPLDPALTPTSPDAVAANGKYRVPAANPFVGVSGVDEIFAFGLRNPFRFSFDTAPGVDRLVAGDVGQGRVEEVDLVEKGKNYGWHLKEGAFLFDPNTGDISPDINPDPTLINPVIQYSHDDGTAVIGGYVYRGTAIPELAGKYLFGDLSKGFAAPAGRLFYGDLDTGTIKELNIGFGDDSLGRYLKGFGEDGSGELYVLASGNIGPGGATGQVLKMVPSSEISKAIGDKVTGQVIQTYATFGIPQTESFAGSFNANTKKTPALFAADGRVLRVLGDGAPGIGSSVITKLGAPSGDGALVTLKAGAGAVTSQTNKVLLAGLSSGALRVAAQSGTGRTGLPNMVTIKTFGAIDGHGSAIFFLARLQGLNVTAKTAASLCVALADGSVKVLAKSGDLVGGKTIATIGTLVGGKGTLAEGRWRVDDSTFGVRLTFADTVKSQALYSIPAGAMGPADWKLLLPTGQGNSVPSINTTTITSFGLPGFGPQSFAVLATLALSAGNVTSADNVALITGPAGGPLNVLRRKGGQIAADADGHPLNGVMVKGLSDPVVGAGRRVAYMITATDAGFGSGIEYAADGTTPVVLANVGAAAPDGGHWASFTSLALPDGAASGPLFTGTLAINTAEGVTGKNNLGLWGVDSTGKLRLLLRSNQPLFVKNASRTLKTFTALAPAAGSTGAASGYDNDANVAVLATFTDGLQALLKLTVP
ncbi:MAG: hypothetical protein QOE70_2818 [Chthoniobacter sp.]|jgi:glucose/arabinose dehydrogenase|nr:hypothetical protein [Chthoniobacter sp.]